jgi:hypothetical protein
MDRSKFDELMAKSEPPKQKLPGPLDEVERPEETGHMQFGFDVVEVQRVGLKPGDVLMVTVKNDDLSQESVNALRMQLETVFPNNKVFVFAMGTTDDVKISVVSQSEASYCSDCNCGKKPNEGTGT